jgi:RNA polymerase sigma-70 factor (ECF subfamily)
MEEELVALLPRLRRFARALCHDVDTADDLVQAACERALNAAASFAPGTRLDSWMCRILQNLWIDRCRSAASRGPHVDLDAALELQGADGRRDTEAQLMLARVRLAIAELPEEQRLVLALVSIEGLSYRDAAEQIGVPIGTVMSRLARARARLMALVAGSDAEPAAAARG